MVGYGEDTKVHNLFDPSNQNTFIEISVQFEKEVIPDLELALGECSSPPPQDDVKDEYFLIFSDIYDYDMSEDDYYGHFSPIWPKGVEKITEVAGDLAGNPLDPRKTRSQFHTASLASEFFIDDK